MKRKGTFAERELLRMFFAAGWAGTRTAGSGSAPLPVPDLLVGFQGKSIAIECKSIKKATRYIEPDQIKEILEFSGRFGAEPYIAARFNRKGWFFIKIEDLHVSPSGKYAVSLKLAQEKGLKFEDIINS